MTAITALVRRLVLFAAFLLPVPLLAADLACAPPADSGNYSRLEVPDEVSASARETVSSSKGMQSWLRRLVGQYSFEGYTKLCGDSGDQQPVKGRVDCIAASAAPDVHCTVSAKWSAATGESGTPVLRGVSNLAPAQFLFSIESPMSYSFYGDGLNHWGVVFVQVDNKGIGEFASGVLVGDTFLSTEPCVDIRGDCQKIKRITARPDSNEIYMTLEIVMDRQRVLHQAFLLQRQPTRKGE